MAEAKPTVRWPNLAFWGVLVGLEVLLFLPFYLVNMDRATFWPPLDLFGDPIEALKQIGRRGNPDIFRLNLEVLAVLVGLLIWPRLRTRNVQRVFLLGYAVILGYHIYEAVIWRFYHMAPNFYNDMVLLNEGLKIIVDVFDWSLLGQYILPVLGLAAVIYAAKRLLQWGAPQIAWNNLHWASKVGMLGLLVAVTMWVMRFHRTLDDPRVMTTSAVVKMVKNTQASRGLAAATARFDHERVVAAHAVPADALVTKPDVFLIFIESYGSILLHDPELRSAYLAQNQKHETTLTSAGWHVVSHLMTSPVSGGSSWLAYTSLLFGTRVDNQGFYQFLLQHYQAATYPDLGQTMKDQGYTYYRLAALPTRQTDQIPWAAYTRLYNVDHWIRYEDMAFEGQAYGWGPSPPDQFSLHFATDRIRSEQAGPFVLFFITQNSHYPWTYMPEVVPDWRTLNDPHRQAEQPEVFFHEASATTYGGAIVYQWEYLTQFITQYDRPAVFILVGDHQPPLMTPRDAGFETPLHILSQDATFLAHFATSGFQAGLTPNETAPPIEAAGVYSLFLRALLAQYGHPELALPADLPAGVIFD